MCGYRSVPEDRGTCLFVRSFVFFCTVTDLCAVCFFPHDISKTDAAGITKLDTEILHDESWKFIYFGVKKIKGQAHVRVTNTLQAWIFVLL